LALFASLTCLPAFTVGGFELALAFDLPAY